MIRILVVDDERPVVEGIAHIVRRDLGEEFEIAGSASSGREAIEKAALLSPDLILMDVRMPGISGLDAIREIRRRGSLSAFILITAYERFDIAREAVELGVLDYLLKPVAKDKLAFSLREAALLLAGRGEVERREIEHREREERMRAFVEAAFLQGLMLGERSGPELEKYRSALGIPEPWAAAAAAAILSPLGVLDPAAEAREAYEGLRGTIRYKTKALVGPLVSGLCAILLPLRDEAEGPAMQAELRAVIEAAHGSELARGRLRLGFGGARPLPEAASSWSEALAGLLAGASAAGSPASEGPREGVNFEDDEAFLEALLASSPERASLALERLLGPLKGLPSVAPGEAYRFIALFGAAIRSLRGSGLMNEAEVRAAMDFEDLRMAASGDLLALALRGRFSALAAAAGREGRRSLPLRAAIDRIKEAFGRPISLESVADELGIPPGRLSRLFIEETGKGFSDFLIDYRIERAKELLSLPDASIKQVSAACGYPDPNYFSRLFKKATGLTPSNFSSDAKEANDGNG